MELPEAEEAGSYPFMSSAVTRPLPGFNRNQRVKPTRAASGIDLEKMAHTEEQTTRAADA